MKVANVKLTWVRSVSTDVVKTKVIVTLAGAETTTEFGPEVQELVLDINASTNFSFKVVSIDAEGNQTDSEVYSYTLGDLVPPQAATNLSHEVLSIKDV